MDTSFSELVVAPVTPFHPDGSLHLERIDALLERYLNDGVTGAFICGTTGEGLSLDREERCRVAERWIAAAPRSFRIIVHVGHQSLEESRALARHARDSGAYGIGSIGPTYYRPQTSEELAAYAGDLAAATPEIPFYYYHIPVMTGLAFPMIEFLNFAGPRIPNLKGLKFTDTALADFSQCLHREKGRYEIFFGKDEMLLGALAIGARSAIGSSYNFSGRIVWQMIRAFEKGDLQSARHLQGQVGELVGLIYQIGGLAALKQCMNWIGLDCGPVRSPLRALSREQTDRLSREVKPLLSAFK